MSPGPAHFRACAPASRALPACHLLPVTGCAFPGLSSSLPHAVPECSPVVHRLPPSGCGLGPTNPTRTDLPSEPFDFRRSRFSLELRYSCQHSHSRPLQLRLPLSLLRWRDALLPLTELPSSQSLTSVLGFSPVPFSAHARSTSELLRTLSRVAASKPTSWLSAHAHIVSHSAET